MFPFIISCQKLANPSRLLTYSTCADVGVDKRGHLVEWVGKASFNWLNRLFKIAASERNYQTLLSYRNLLVVGCTSSTYFLGDCLRWWCSESTLSSRISPFTRRPMRRTPRLTKSALATAKRESKRGPCGGPLARNVARRLLRLVHQSRRRREL